MGVRRRLAVVVAGAGAGGAVARVALEQAAGLSGRFDVTVISDSLPPGEKAFGFLAVPARKFGWMRRFGHAFRAADFARKSARVLRGLDREQSLDFVWCHGHGEALAAARSGFAGRVGMAVHGDIFSRPRGTYDALLTGWYRRVTPPAYRACSLIQVFSEAGKAAAIRGGGAAARVFVLPNGISPRDFGEVSAKPENAGKRILFVGRISAEKGLGDLIRAMAEEGLRGCALEVVGDGPLGEECRSRAASLKIEVQFVGWVPRGELGKFYRRADVLCCPSLDEAFATVILEAMLFGLPVVATRVGGTPDIVVDGATGLLCAPSSPLALSSALARILADRELALRMGKNGRERVLRDFCWADICRRLGDRIASEIA